MSKPCKDCGEEIEFYRANDGARWIPVVPGTEERHRCKLEQICEACQKPFQGAPWMKTCPSCYRSGRTAPGSPPAAPSSPQPKEPLQDDMSFDDDAPPF